MARRNYGSVSLNTAPSPQLTNSTSTLDKINQDNLIQAARIIYIMLDDSDKVKFEQYGGWNGIGTIEYQLVSDPTTTGIAYSINPNLKVYPLKNELVYLISNLPNQNLENNTSVRKYYISSINLWNHPHHNGYPLNPNALPNPQQGDYIQSTSGNVRKVIDQPTEINLGKTFKEKSNIHPLLTFEGDAIYEGRWGNSIRLGSTVNNSPSSITNNWSETGDNGDPLVIIRNGQGLQTNEGWIPVTENINNDNSSIYLTSTQKIPIETISNDYASYSSNPPTLPDQYAGTQIILNSGRLLFNSYEDHILFSSAKSINLNSQTSVNIDTKDFTIQNSDGGKIFLGGPEYLNLQPLLLGNQTYAVLKIMYETLSALLVTLRGLESDPVVNLNTPVTFTQKLQTNMADLEFKLNEIRGKLGTSAENSSLTSKRSFTI